MSNSYNVVITSTRPSISTKWAFQYAFDYWGELYNTSGIRIGAPDRFSANIAPGPITIEPGLEGITPFFMLNPDRVGLLTDSVIGVLTTISNTDPFAANTSVVPVLPSGYTPKLGGTTLDGQYYLGSNKLGRNYGVNGDEIDSLSLVRNDYFTVSNVEAVSGWTTNSSDLVTLYVNTKMAQANVQDTSGQSTKWINWVNNIYSPNFGITLTASATPA